jgi:hypothetical protein
MIALICLYVAAFSAFLSFFLEYSFGFPMSDRVNTKAIFFKWTYFLAFRRLKKVEPIAVSNDDDKGYIVSTARGFWVWEYALGMCKVCSNVWVAAICYGFTWLMVDALHVGFWSIINGLSTVLLSHFLVRKFL